MSGIVRAAKGRAASGRLGGLAGQATKCRRTGTDGLAADDGDIGTLDI
jgi:hypothetical protein